MSTDAADQKLTDEQVAICDKIAEDWHAEAFRCCLIEDREEVIRLADELYMARGLTPAGRYLFLTSPFAGGIAADVLMAKWECEEQGLSLDGCRWDASWTKLSDGALIERADSVSSIIFEQELSDDCRLGVRQRINEMMFGNMDGHWIMHFEMAGALGWDMDEYRKMKPCAELSRRVGWWSPYDTMILFQQRPLYVRVNADDQPHCDGDSYIKWLDGSQLYMLNGVRVSKELCLTKAENLDPRIILKEDNVEVRREIVRKIGIERICHGLGAKVVDTYRDYELLLLDIGDNRMRPYLKMVNPSIGTYHVEGVHPDCKTVIQALHWRNGINELPDVLT